MPPKKPNTAKIMTPGSFPNTLSTSPPALDQLQSTSSFEKLEFPPQPQPQPQPTMAADKLESEELVKLLEIIDKLREFGVSEDISLPQVCFF